MRASVGLLVPLVVLRAIDRLDLARATGPGRIRALLDARADRDAALGVLGHDVGDTRAAGVSPWLEWIRSVL